MAKKEIEGVGKSMQTAYDLKGKVVNLMTYASEVVHQINAMMDDVQKLSQVKSEVDKEVSAEKKEKTNLDRILETLRKTIADERKAHEEWKAKETAEIASLKKSARSENEEAKRITDSIRQNEAELNARIEEFDKKRRDLERRFEKIKELAA